MTSPFDIIRPAGAEIPLVLDSPHSGTHYPEDFQPAVSRELLRQAEDSFVDELYASGPSLGATLIAARFPRSYIDPNRSLLDIDTSLSPESVQSSWHDLQQIKEQAQTMFELGLLELDVKARVESLFWQVAERMQLIVRTMDPEEVPEDVRNLQIELADQHICNFSVFQSLLDHWALGQLFPIVPIHRLNERPQLESTLVDITCDSDGKVSKFIDLNDVRETLPLHEIRATERYYLGIFLTGAYQDIMGDIHNLFGRVNEVHVFLDPDEESGFYIEEEIPGQPIGEVLAMTQWDWRDLEKRMKQQIDVAIKQDRVKPNEGMRLLQDYERGLKDQTYLTFE